MGKNPAVCQVYKGLCRHLAEWAVAGIELTLSTWLL